MQLQEDPIVNSIYMHVFILHYILRGPISCDMIVLCGEIEKGVNQKGVNRSYDTIDIDTDTTDTTDTIDRTTDCAVRTGKVVVAEKCDYHQKRGCALRERE